MNNDNGIDLILFLRNRVYSVLCTNTLAGDVMGDRDIILDNRARGREGVKLAALGTRVRSKTFRTFLNLGAGVRWLGWVRDFMT